MAEKDNDGCKIIPAIEAVIRDLPSKAVASLKQESLILLQKVQSDEHKDEVLKFSKILTSTFEEHITQVTHSVKARTSKQQKIWSSFHQLRFCKTLYSTWSQFITSLHADGLNSDNRPLQQAVFEELYKMCVEDSLSSCKVEDRPTSDSPLTVDELNVVRYVGGYVARSLLRKYEKMNTLVALQFVDCLGEMAVDGEGGNALDYTKIWMDKVNRGGLYPLNDQAFSLCVSIEKRTRELLPKHLAQPGCNEDAFTEKVHDKVLEDDDVQFFWTLLCQETTLAEDSEALLKEFIKLWITIRGFSVAASWMQVYKDKEKKNTTKSTGLRKSISGGR